MTVEIEDRRRRGDINRLPGLGLANGTWFAIVFLKGMVGLVEQRKTTDPWVVSPRQAKRMAAIVEKWTPPETWGSDDAGRRADLKQTIVDFLYNCNGFRTF